MNERKRRANALMMKYYSGMIDEGSWKTAAGDIAVFNTKYRRNLKSLIVQLEPIQSGSGDPSPDNVRPISGWTGANIYLEHSYDAQATPVKTVSWQTEAGTVYGGTVDVISGVLTIEQQIKTYIGAESERWYYYPVSAGNLYRIDILDAKPTPNTSIINAISNMYMPAAYAQRANYTMSSYRDTVHFDFINNDIASLEDWKSALADNNLQIVYKLAEPITYQLTPQQIQTLIGENVIWSDAGPVDVEYWS